MNKTIIEVYGGTYGTINQGTLAFCLWRSLSLAMKNSRNKGRFYKTWAARTLKCMAQKHPFTDGNKRTAFITASLILALGKFDFNINYKYAVKYMRKIASRKVGYNKIYKWVGHHSEPLKKPIPKKVKVFVDMLAELVGSQY